MTPERAKELLPIIQAYAEGKTIQIKFGNSWIRCVETNFDDYSEYRIAPEPKVIYVNESKGLPWAYWSKEDAERASKDFGENRIAVKYIEASD